jgi:hypothetical protein
MEVVTIESQVWTQLCSKLEKLEHSIELSRSNQTAGADEWLNYVPLQEALKLLGINRRKWNRYYKSQIIYKKFNVDIWVLKNSIKEFLERNNIIPKNKKTGNK